MDKIHELCSFMDIFPLTINGFKLGMCSLKMVLSRRNMSEWN